MLPREYRIFKEYGYIRHGNLLSLMACIFRGESIAAETLICGCGQLKFLFKRKTTPSSSKKGMSFPLCDGVFHHLIQKQTC